jgi:hypothetical protein
MKMSEKFIKNDAYNFIQKQVDLIKDSSKKNADPTVIKAVKELANARISELFPNIEAGLMEILDLSHLKTDFEFDQYLQRLSSYLLPFPALTQQQLKKLFPKNKKLKLPDFSDMDFNRMTYLGWNDIGTNKKFIVYEMNDQLMGIECKFSPLNKDNICSFCNRFGKVAFITTITKAKKSNNPDYYKSIGNYICLESEECNKKITNTGYLTAFLREALG